MALDRRADRRRRWLLPAGPGQRAPGERASAHSSAAREPDPRFAALVVLRLRRKRRGLPPPAAARLLRRDAAAERSDPDAAWQASPDRWRVDTLSDAGENDTYQAG